MTSTSLLGSFLFVALALSGCDQGSAVGDKAKVISASLGSATTISDVFFGYNNGEHETTAQSLSDDKLIAAVKAQSVGTYRYPGGTVANYWDWKQGCQTGKSACGKLNNKLEDFAKLVKETGVEPIIVVNMLTSTLDDQLAFVDAAAAAGLEISRVELGNEFFNNHDDFIKAFPTGADYGSEATKWAKAISAKYPKAVFAAVGAPAIIGDNDRKEQWNDKMFSALEGINVVTMHEYHDSQIGKSDSFKSKDVATMLGAPFHWLKVISDAADKLPSGVQVWMTEFNLKDDDAVGVAGTWAHGLFIATEVVLALQSSRMGLVNMHNTISAANAGALFADSSSFDFDNTPDKTLPTVEFGRAATGWTTYLLATAFKGQTRQEPLVFSPNPQITGVNHSYASLLGAALSKGPNGPSAVVINLASSEQDLDLSQAGGPYSSYQSVSAADPTTPINEDSKLTFAKGSVPKKTLQLPAYSVTILLSSQLEEALIV